MSPAFAEIRRARRLQRFSDALIEILRHMNEERRKRATREEKHLLGRFLRPEAPFSAMFRDYGSTIEAL